MLMARNTRRTAAAPGLLTLLLLLLASHTSAFHLPRYQSATRAGAIGLHAQNNDGESDLEYKNAPTKILSNFMSKPEGTGDGDAMGSEPNPIDAIDFAAPKFARKVDLPTLAAILDYELSNKEWFVTGNVNPIYFADDFEFQDPDVQLSGIEDYARGVYKLFDQSCSRAEIISCEVDPTLGPNIITVTWRLSGKVSIGPGLTIKPYVCYSDLTVDEESGLIVRQEDRFSVPQWDILLSALFPFLIGKITKEPAPPVEPRVVTMPSVVGLKGGASNPFENILGGLFA